MRRRYLGTRSAPSFTPPRDWRRDDSPGSSPPRSPRPASLPSSPQSSSVPRSSSAPEAPSPRPRSDTPDFNYALLDLVAQLENDSLRAVKLYFHRNWPAAPEPVAILFQDDGAIEHVSNDVAIEASPHVIIRQPVNLISSQVFDSDSESIPEDASEMIISIQAGESLTLQLKARMLLHDAPVMESLDLDTLPKVRVSLESLFRQFCRRRDELVALESLLEGQEDLWTAAVASGILDKESVGVNAGG
ncbi:uncharacterized protein FTOL_08461 [Fusarium torulosum]|uniref:Uncharacterized protein n=1 Tax=Fusarium torulosum TaxID=33205 RepID=A0AAE8MCM6_9HYPO|nr:uncharacterized protein FTOL_08461 [Fusarium torulosum]